MIFIDSNVPMYLVGAEHPNKIAARRLLERAIANGERLVSDAEVLQEILHRYAAIARRDAIQPAFDALVGVVDEIFPVEQRDVLRAKDIFQGSRNLSAGDAIHAALMERNGVSDILTFDAGFDQVPGIRRLLG
ncbi:MAG: type II toxin-antitoxin system VapC family toxin [Burkholderiales bacterium]|nr:type II toxin-antitoxin system VapC family toxin [Burkholderiales bacterium]